MFQTQVRYQNLMNLRSIYYFLASLILFTIFSCQESKEDKYPDIPFFPDTLNSNWEIIKFN